MIIYYAAKNIVSCLKTNLISIDSLCDDLKVKCQSEWLNIGGQLMPSDEVDKLRVDIKNGTLNNWNDIHARYNTLWQRYPLEKFYHACLSLSSLENKLPDKAILINTLNKAIDIQQYICYQVYLSRKKDYDNDIRNATFRNDDERDAVNGRLEDNSFIKQIKADTEQFIKDIEEIKNKS